MNQLMQSRMSEEVKQTTKDTRIDVQSFVPAINKEWVNRKINEFLEEEIKLSQPARIILKFEAQPVRHKIIKCQAWIELEKNTMLVSGEGIDEYEAVSDLINNLDIELKLSFNNPLEDERIFFSHLTKNRTGGGQYA